MTPQGTMWHLYSKSQPEEEASVLQSQGMKDLLFEKVYIIMLFLIWFKLVIVKVDIIFLLICKGNISRVLMIKIDNFYPKDFAFSNKDTCHPFNPISFY